MDYDCGKTTVIIDFLNRPEFETFSKFIVLHKSSRI